jgi:chemotaxis protein methyltransferase CheR
LRHVPAPELAARWLTVGERSVTIDRKLIEHIRWNQLNLIDAPAIAALGPLDWILCRNVLIYFRDETAARVVNNMAGQLRPGGVLLVGVSESLMRFGTALSCEEHAGVFSYRKARA